ncbi:MAG: hypothetical protein IKN95_06530 [Lachnospiraceae bacterium]|nr:hypothetical protein [Lachnospiraceae bacterium]
MITGTLYEAGKMMVMQNKWEQKKSTGNINKKEQKELTPQERDLQRYREQLEETKKGNEYSALYSKIQSGQKLSPAEEDKLKAQDMKAYLDYKADQAEQEAYEERLKRCRTKDEAQRLQTAKMQGNLSKIKNIENDPYISDAEKLKMARIIQGDTTANAKIYQEFTQSEEYEKMPTEGELQQLRKMERDAENAELQEIKEDISESQESESEIVDEPTEVSNDLNQKVTNEENMKTDAQETVSLIKEKEKSYSGSDTEVLMEMQSIIGKLKLESKGNNIDIFA